MKSVLNKTRRPLAIRLSRGKVLRLGPGKEGQISVHDVELESITTLIAKGDIVVIEDGPHGGSGQAANPAGRLDSRGHHPAFGVVKRGER